MKVEFMRSRSELLVAMVLSQLNIPVNNGWQLYFLYTINSLTVLVIFVV